MRGTSACLTASQQTRTSFSMARASPAMRGPLTSPAIALTASKSSGEAIGKPASMMSTRSLASCRATSSFSARFMLAPGRLLAVAQRGVEDLDVSRGAHESLTSPVTARVAVRKIGASVPDRRVAQWAGRCLSIPPEGEQQAAEELEVAGAYLNVGLPAGLACRTRDAWSGECTSGARAGARRRRGCGRRPHPRRRRRPSQRICAARRRSWPRVNVNPSPERCSSQPRETTVASSALRTSPSHSSLPARRPTSTETV